MADMTVEDSEGNGSSQVPLEVSSKSSNVISDIGKKKKSGRCQGITNTEIYLKMLETQLAVAHDWSGIAHDVAQGHHQMSECLMDMLNQ
ncbi:hypothetical protein CDAR_293981 [Caerostris darwini]|uniref:Uncharacterized protein n=1 Tax=Caerostris darwini TaxID=1538125 RepID=A0AAV4VFZ0_9ARAC|nr:hypothetical protein CDAR_293981 [Caerostris darwini]